MSTPIRPPRADAVRNRTRLLDAARVAFGEQNDAAISLEGVARSAGVGIGTLYRHFPTREALVEALYAEELGALESRAGELAASGRADVGLRMWLDDYAVFLAAKRPMLEVLRPGWESGALAAPNTRLRIVTIVDRFLAAGAEQGVLRGDVPSERATTLLVGVFLSSSGADGAGATSELLDLAVDALRPR